MNALYNCCFADPWVKVAQILRDEHNFQPVYWIGFPDDGSGEIISEQFSETIYHGYYDAWRGIFPEEIEKISTRYCVDIDFYRDISWYELQGLSLMDRMDADQHSFSFAERRELFRKMLRCWTAVINHLEIDVLISPIIPHMSFDYPLFLVCRQKGIKMFSFASTPFYHGGRVIASDDIYSLPAKIKSDYKKICKSNGITLAGDIQSVLDKVRQDYQAAVPRVVVEDKKFFHEKPSVRHTIRSFLHDLKTNQKKWFGNEGIVRRGMPLYWKQKNKDIEESKVRYNLLQYSLIKHRNIRLLKSLQKAHAKITRPPDLDKPYAAFALHYQPEATSMPRGGIFYNQLYVLELLSKYLPEEWNIYVKENSRQFNPVGEGQTGRLMRFYRDAMKFPRISFVPSDTNPFTLIDRAKVVVTVAGTFGWEAMARQKPVICFGLSWYSSFSDGVLQINDTKSLGKVVEFVKNFKYNEQALVSYLKAVEKNSIVAYFRRNLKEYMGIREDQCVKTLVQSVTGHFEDFSSA